MGVVSLLEVLYKLKVQLGALLVAVVHCWEVVAHCRLLIHSWAVLRGFLGFLETPWGLPGLSPASIHCKMIVATCLPNVAFSKLNCQWIQLQASRSSPDPALLNSSAADAEPPEKHQVMAKGLFLMPNYTL